jgi:hypothetical protein
MSRRFDLWAPVVCIGILAGFTPRDASASSVLLYTGQPYTTVSNHPLIFGEYDLTMRVTGMVELAVPLPPSCICVFDFGFEDPPRILDISFFDGVWSYGPGADVPATDEALITFTTDASGNIVSFAVSLFESLGGGVPTGGSDIVLELSSISGDFGYTLCDNCDPTIVQSFSTDGIGTWTVVSVPEPASISLLLIGFAGAGIGRRLLSSRACRTDRTRP